MANFLPKIYFSFSVPSVVFLKILNPKLFTELNPSQDIFDDQGNAINNLEKELDTIYKELISGKKEKKMIRP